MNNIEKIKNKILKGERLLKKDGIFLLKSNDLLSMGRLADAENQKRSKNKVFFNINCHVNITNICVAKCSFCAFSCDKGDSRAYEMSLEDIINKIRSSLNAGITEVHIVSGLHPDKPFDFYLKVIKEINCEFPSIHIKAFTPVEIKYFSNISGLSIKDVLVRLKDAGLGSMPGGGAEVLSRRVRKEVCPEKATADDWLDIMETAHLLGLKSNATLLYGHIETEEEIINHLLSLRDLQDKTGGFQTFIPLPFHPDNTGIVQVNKPTAFEQLRIFALSRLMLDNFEHIKAYWVMTGLKNAQLAIHFGADDIDGTVVDEKITHAAGADTAEGLTVGKLTSLIKSAGKIPVQRDTLYNIIKTY
jgi:aminodeoxyfutalosine synthase